MKTSKTILIFLLVFTLFIGCSKEKETKFDKEKYRTELAGLSRDYLLGLKSILKKNLKRSGPVKAITVCSDTASDLTNMFANAMQLNVRRVSFKNRNPNNIPDEIETKVLHKYEKLLKEGKLNEKTETFDTYTLGGKKIIRYMKPIIVDSPCLNCHGNKTNIKKEVAKIIQKNYPEDKAINYVKGDLRGAVSITKEL